MFTQYRIAAFAIAVVMAATASQPAQAGDTGAIGPMYAVPPVTKKVAAQVGGGQSWKFPAPTKASQIVALERKGSILPIDRQAGVLPLDRQAGIFPLDRQAGILPLDRRGPTTRLERNTLRGSVDKLGLIMPID